MWTESTWESEEDVEKDILLMAEYSIPTKEDLDPNINKIPDTILNYRKQMAQNKERTLNSDIDESASYIISGRGRGIRDRVIRPGGTVDCHPSDEVELKKQIRQVAGIGYSNELIEQAIKAKGYNPEENSNNSNFKLVPCSASSSSCNSSPSSSGKSSVDHTPIKKKFFNLKTENFPPLK